MLAAVSHSPAWRNQGYVCLACRRQKLRVNGQQRRWNSEGQCTTAQASSDDWFSTLNDISDTFGDPPKSKPKPEPEAKVSKKEKATQPKEAKEREDGRFAFLKHSLEANLPASAAKSNPTVHDLRQGLNDIRLRSSTPAKTHKAKRKQRQAAGTKDTSSLDHLAIQELPDTALAKETNSRTIPDLVESLKLEQVVKAAEDGEGLSWTQEAHDFLEMGEKEETVDGDAAVEADDTEPRPLPAFSANGLSKTFRYGSAVDNVRIPPGTTSKTSKELQTPSNVDEPPETPASYKAKTSPAASGLGGRITQDEPQPRTLSARWRKQQELLQPFGVQKGASGQALSGVSFDSLRSADKVSGDTTAKSKKSSTPFGLGVAASRGIGPGVPKRNAGQGGQAASSVKSKTGANSQDKPNDMDSLRASLQAQNDNVEEAKVEEEGPEAAEAATQPRFQPEPAPEPALESQPESTTSETVEPGDVKAHESLTNLYKIRYSSPRKPDPRVSTEREGHPKAKAAVEDLRTEVSTPAGQSIADAMKQGGSAKQGSGSAPPESPPSDESPPEEAQASSEQIMSLDPSSINVEPLDISQPHVPYLEYGLDRVLFNPGVYQLQDPASRVYNFDPYLQEIMPVTDFDFNALKEYKTSSQDKALSALAMKEGKKYIGSTSSMTSSLAHFHYLLSNFRPVNTQMYSREFAGSSPNGPRSTFTEINRAPSSIFLRWKNGTYAIDADKEYDSGNVLMLLGKSMELLLTLPKDDYERYRKSDPRQVPEEQRTGPEAYQYTTMRDFLMRSQLDAYDPRLPGNGTFDLKTRAVVSIRHSATDYERMTGYELFNLQGKWGSYEREYYDMTRSTMLKYMLQARMGRMNGIFVAYHNVKRIFGFQYIPMHEMDRALHGQTDSCLGDQEFKASLDIMNAVFNKATEKFPNQSLRFTFETRPERDDMPTALHVFAEPMADKDIDAIQNSQKEKIAAFERDIMGKEDEPIVDEDAQNQPLDAESGNVVEDGSSAQPTVDEDATTECNNDEVAVEKETPTVHTTESPADRVFLDKIATQDSELAPLFYATVITQSKVDGEYIEADRVADLKRDQKWEIDYILKEYEVTRHQWALYEDSKARRKHAFDHSDDDADDVEDKKPSHYLQFLKSMSEKGAEIRKKVDAIDAGRDVVRVEKPLARERESIDSVEDYMGWMYRAKDAQ